MSKEINLALTAKDLNCMAKIFESNLDKEAQPTEVYYDNDFDMKDSLDEKTDPTEIYYCDNSNMEEFHPNVMVDTTTKVDEINIRSKIFIVILEKAKPPPRFEQSLFEESFIEEKANGLKGKIF